MRIGIIGHFGGNEIYNDGQTVKTVTTYNALKKHGIQFIDKIDTYYIKKNPFMFCMQLTRSFFRDEKYIILLSARGRKALFPVFYVMSKYLKKKIFHYAIGGDLVKQIEKNEKCRRYISSFKGNWMESNILVDQLQELGIRNAIYIPNFKALTILNEKELVMDYCVPFKFCTFSRVMVEKGIEDAIFAIHSINEKAKKEIATLDIYGPIERGYEERFQNLLVDSKHCHYCGVVPANKSVETLKNYYMLLFPTFWRGEGMPGTVIDALSAGVPVIARQWKYCNEILENRITGYIYNFNEPDKLIDTIIYSVVHKEETIAMKKNCIEKAEQYSEPYVMEQILGQLTIP